LYGSFFCKYTSIFVECNEKGDLLLFFVIIVDIVIKRDR